jgi:hypothetical protein
MSLVKFYWKLNSSSRLFYLKLWQPFCAAKLNMQWYAQQGMILNSREFWYKSRQQFDLYFYLQLWWPFCAVKRNVLAIWTTKDSTNYSSEVWLEYFPVVWSVKSKQDFIFEVLAGILCRKAEHAGDMQNYGWYWLPLWSLVEIPPVFWPVGTRLIYSSGGHFVNRSETSR